MLETVNRGIVSRSIESLHRTHGNISEEIDIDKTVRTFHENVFIHRVRTRVILVSFKIGIENMRIDSSVYVGSVTILTSTLDRFRPTN